MQRFKARALSLGVKAFTAAALVAASAMVQPVSVKAQAAKITVGMVIGGSGFHLPTYVAMDKGFYKGEGLDTELVAMNGVTLVKAGLAKQLDFVPIPGGGTVAMLKGAPIICCSARNQILLNVGPVGRTPLI